MARLLSLPQMCRPWPIPINSRSRLCIITSILISLLLIISTFTADFDILNVLLPFDALPLHPAISALHPLPRPAATTSQGTYRGTTLRSNFPHPIEIFLGIPYAQSTAGENRFRAPKPLPLPLDPNNLPIFDATEYGNRCPCGTDGGVKESEDCLNLNIYRPRHGGEFARLPVAVYIHGGAFNSGGARERAMSSMVGWSRTKFIGVSLNYRMGAFGFLNNGLEGANVGLKDQQLALKWIKENIAAFGGDPDNVTIMGSSAGAHSVGHHLMNAAAPKLFNQVIIESGGPTARAVYPHDHPLHRQQFKEFLEMVGGTTIPDDQIMGFLRNQDFAAIKSASQAIYSRYNPSVRWPFQPVVDGEGGMIPVAPIEAWRTGKWNRVPVLTGFNSNEGNAFVPRNMATPEAFTEFFHTLLPQLSAEDLKTLNDIYPDPSVNTSSRYVDSRSGVGSQFKRAAAAYGQFAYIAPVRDTANLAISKEANPESVLPQPIYLYEFAVNKSVIGGANHGDQNEYVSRVMDQTKIPRTHRDISGQMHAYWTSFIVTGDPNAIRKGKHRNRPRWPMYHEGVSRQKIVFGLGNDERAGGKTTGFKSKVMPDEDMVTECDFWWSKIDLFESLPPAEAASPPPSRAKL